MLLLGGFATVAAMPILLGQLQLTPEALTAFRSAVIEAPSSAAAVGK